MRRLKVRLQAIELFADLHRHTLELPNVLAPLT
jgi:hypothetical protein